MFTHTYDLFITLRFQLLFLLTLLTLATTAMAGEIDSDQDNWQGSRTLEIDSSGFLFSLPTINQSDLEAEITGLNQQLQERQSDLNAIIERSQFSATDAFLVAALPGGLIYAAIKKQRKVAAEKELSEVQTQIDSLNQPPLARLDPPEYTLFAAR